MKKIIVFIFLFILSVILAFLALNNGFYAVITVIITSALFSLFFEEVVNNFKTWLNIPIRTSKLTIFLYGRGGSGKTTFIKSLLTTEDVRNNLTRSTKNVEYYEGRFSYSPNLNPNRRFNRRYEVPITIADYKGQAPNQALQLKKRK